jgi:MFS family permease
MLGRADFRRLFATRLLSQFGDGVFQAALAGTVLFNPQRAAEPVDVAAGFAVLLLPYSVVGPFAGVWLDRWSRRQVLLTANLVRAGLVAAVAGLVLAGVAGLPFYTAGLLVFSVNRFVLAALSAGLPHTVDEPSLVSANALSTTSGTVATVIGGVTALALLQVTGNDDAGYAILAVSAALPYVASAATVAGFRRAYLGPDHPARSALLSAREVVVGMVSGARHAWAEPPARAALTAIAVHRLGYGFLTLMTLLLYRNTFPDWGPLFPTGLPGLAEVVAAGAAGALLAAVITPAVVRRIGKPWWITVLLAAAGVGQLALGLAFVPPAFVAMSLLLGVVGQGIKICVDTTLQECIDDDHRGRVFSVYDTLFNVPFVIAVVVAAFTLPDSGVSPAVLVAVTVAYLATAWWYRSATARKTRPSHSI